MPVTIQPATLRYKNGNTFSAVDCLKGDPGSIANIASDYNDLTFPVLQNKLCTHDNKLYKANQNIQTAEAWNSSHWTETTIDDEIRNGSGTSGLPSGGSAGDLLVKSSNSDYAVEWASPANSAEQDNTRPITAAAVYTEIGNINALLATI